MDLWWPTAQIRQKSVDSATFSKWCLRIRICHDGIVFVSHLHLVGVISRISPNASVDKEEIAFSIVRAATDKWGGDGIIIFVGVVQGKPKGAVAT